MYGNTEAEAINLANVTKGTNLPVLLLGVKQLLK
jgi:hypothetical protein